MPACAESSSASNKADLPPPVRLDLGLSCHAQMNDDWPARLSLAAVSGKNRRNQFTSRGVSKMARITPRALLLVAATVLPATWAATSVHVAPLLAQGNLQASVSLTENVRIVCEGDGTCYRIPRRRPVARWVYGDGNFSGPYTGPGNYGNPRYHTA
jgi:hypothetical protein